MTLFSRMFKWDPITTDKIIQSSTLYPSPSFPKPLTFNKRFSIPLLCPTNSLSICTYVCLCYHIDAVIPPLKNQHILQNDQSRVGESNKTYLCHSLVQIFMTLFSRMFVPIQITIDKIFQYSTLHPSPIIFSTLLQCFTCPVLCPSTLYYTPCSTPSLYPLFPFLLSIYTIYRTDPIDSLYLLISNEGELVLRFHKDFLFYSSFTFLH